MLKLLNTYIGYDTLLKDFYNTRPEICKRNLYSRYFEFIRYNDDAYFKFEFKKEDLPDDDPKSMHHFKLILIIEEYKIINSAVEAMEESRREWLIKQMDAEMSSPVLKPFEDPNKRTL